MAGSTDLSKVIVMVWTKDSAMGKMWEMQKVFDLVEYLDIL